MTSETVSRFGGVLGFLEPLLITAAAAALLSPLAIAAVQQPDLRLLVWQLLGTLTLLALAFAVSVLAAAVRSEAAAGSTQPTGTAAIRSPIQGATCIVDPGAASAAVRAAA